MANLSLCFLLTLYTNVFNIIAEKNVAIGRTTVQSSIAHGGASLRSVDGITSGDYWRYLSCSHTDYNGYPSWWCVDLGNNIAIDSIRIYNIKVPINLEFRLRQFEVKLSNSGICDQSGFNSSTSCYKNPNTTQDVYTVDQCNQGTTSFTGRFVFISVNTYLVMCEVEIFEKCNINCQSGKCGSTGVCSGCKAGYYGSQCSERCSSNCNDVCRQFDGVCINCVSGRYGSYCNNTCSFGCMDNRCTQSDGTCSCKDIYYGSTCTSSCSINCQEGLCGGTKQTVHCTSGCIDGYKGHYCQESCFINCFSCERYSNACHACINGWYGTSCQSKCYMNCDEGCQILDGKCNQCKPGTVGDFCNKTCSDGCLSNGSLSTCDRNGFCTLGCKVGFYGDYCNAMCNPSCQDNLCDRMTGVCSNGCVNGKTGDNCTTDCKSGYFGKNCSRTCGKCAGDVPCEISSGTCGQAGCQDGFTGPTCEEVSSQPASDATVIISTVMVLLVILVVVIVVGIIFIRRRRVNNKNGELISSGPVPVISKVDDNISRDIDSQTNEAAEVSYANIQDNEALVYQNLSDKQRSTTCIDLVNIWDYIQTKKEKKEFNTEYQKLPKGLCQPYEFCMNEINRPKNRYKNICAFDHTRVKLEVEDGDPNSDYMNACYISTYGNSGDKYIASQGPNAVNTNEFVRMIWDVDASKIVMVTNFFEDSVEKCVNYTHWPNGGKAKRFGRITIKVTSEDIYAHFTKRQLNITKDGCNSRTLKQYHYTSWPDKGVPADIASLVEFRHHVKTSTAKRPGPMIVHCSAGIGRTGTFLALDYLINEGIAENSVDVFSCLSRMRKERVNMIQTVDQYIFLHDALAVWHLMAESTSDVTSYQQVYQELVTVNKLTGRSRLQDKYEMMNKICEKQDKGEYTAALLPENTSKNRDPNILASDRSRTYLQVMYSNTTDYINAVNLSSYTKKNGYILTQTPLPNTVTDFWVLVVQSETNTIIDFGGDVTSRKDIGEYIPGEMVIDCDSYTITKKNEVEHKSGLMNVITCHITSTSEEDFDRTVKIYQCNFWENDQEIPKSANLIFYLLEEINSLSSNTNESPVVVHCLNGVDKSGLFCVLAAILERLTIEQDVGVLQTIMQLRVQRPQIIKSYEQFKFCFDAVGEYLDNFSTYANAC